MIRHVPTLGSDRQPRSLPREHSSADVVGLEPGLTERLGGHVRATTDAADERHRAFAVQLRGDLGQPFQRHVPSCLDVTGLPFVRLAYVDQLEVT